MSASPSCTFGTGVTFSFFINSTTQQFDWMQWKDQEHQYKNPSVHRTRLSINKSHVVLIFITDLLKKQITALIISIHVRRPKYKHNRIYKVFISFWRCQLKRKPVLFLYLQAHSFILFHSSSKAVLYIALSSFQLLKNKFPVGSDRNINNITATHGPDHNKDPFSPS